MAKDECQHEWKRNEDGTIDEFVIECADEDGHWHNGPQCVKCGYSFCMFCDVKQWEKVERNG